MKTSNFLLTTALVGALVMSAGASAQTATGTLNAKIVITRDCAVSSGSTDLDFASNASTASGPISASNGGFKVKCTNLTPYQIGLQSAANGSATDGSGTMKYTTGGSTYTIGYQLYQAVGATPWGNIHTGTVNTKAAVGTGDDQSYTVYGKTTSTLNVPAGTYTDVVNINVYY